MAETLEDDDRLELETVDDRLEAEDELVTDDDLDTLEVEEVCFDVPLDVVTLAVVLLELDVTTGAVVYSSKRLGPPQYSSLSPPHSIEQPLAATTDPAFKVLPQ